jgi:hypothetical protein
MSDGSTKAVLIYRLIQLISHGFTTILIPFYAIDTELGLYYLFVSMVAAQVLFELGLNQSVLQVSSHINDKKGKDYRQYLQWVDCLFVKAASKFVFFGGFGGVFYLILFNDYEKFISLTYWMILIFSASFLMRIAYRFFLIESEGYVANSYHARTLILLVATVAAWVLILFGFILESLIAFYIVQSLLSNLFLRAKFPIQSASSHDVVENNHCIELKVLKRGIGLSYLAGYMSYNAIIPIVFAMLSAKVAGQLGFSLALFSSITLLSSSFVSAKNHAFATKISSNDFLELNSLFRRQMTFTFSLAVFLLMVIFTFIFLMSQFGFSVVDRLLSLELCFLIGLSAVTSSIIYAQALYVRAHKVEPFVRVSIIVGFISVGLIFLGSLVNINWVVFMYSASIIFISFPLTSSIFLKFYKKNSLIR